MNRRGFFKLAASLLAIPIVKPIMDVLPAPVRDNTSIWVMMYWDRKKAIAIFPKGGKPLSAAGLAIPARKWFHLKGGEQ